MSVNTAVARVIQRRTRVRFIVMLLFLLLIAVAVVVVVRIRNVAKIQEKGRFEEVSISNIKRKLAANAENAGIPAEEMENAIANEIKDIETKEKEGKLCNISPLPSGRCGKGYSMENECCYPQGSKRNKTHEKLQLAGAIIKDVGLSVMAGVIIEKAVYRGLTTSASRAATKSTAAAARQAVKTAVAVARAARTAAAAGKAAAAGTRYAVAASGGPIGLMVAAALLVFDAVSMTLDILDVDGYDSFTSQGLLTNMKNIIDYSVAKEFEKNDIKYPMIFPISTIFPEEMALAQEYMNAQIIEKYLDVEMAKNASVQSIFDKYIQDVIENPDVEQPVPKEYLDFIVNLNRIKHLERDRAIYSKLTELLGDQAYKISFYESISGPDQIGISLSPEGAKEWNSENEEIWLQNNDLFNPPDPETIKIPDEPAACYTDTYYIYTSGPADKPNMSPKKLPEKTVIANYYGSLLAFCEKMRKMKSSSTGVNPKALGTRFNFDTGICEFSKDLCKRYGLEFKDNDCKPRPGQGVAELIFGTTITRASIREWDQRIEDFKSGDPGKVSLALLKVGYDPTGILSTAVQEGMKSYPKKAKPTTIGDCPSGMRDDGVNCWLDPVYRGTGKPLGCKADEEKKGQLCYPKCRDGYKSSGLECEGKCPKGSTNTGLTCLQPIHAYIPGNKCSNPFRKCFYQRAPCRDGYTYRGTTCNEKCLPDFTFRSGAAGSAFCDKPRNRYSRAGDAKPLSLSSCPDGEERQGLLCYKKCSDKGDQGQYKYKGVLDWCQPEGGAGIKKGLDDRMKCPDGWERKGPLCYEPCKEGERDDGLFCKKME